MTQPFQLVLQQEVMAGPMCRLVLIALRTDAHAKDVVCDSGVRYILVSQHLQLG